MISPHAKPRVCTPGESLYLRIGKRLFDVLLVVVLAPIIMPVLAVVALGVWGRLGSPILFCQVRVGRGGKEFVLYKFRSMTNALNEQGQPAADELRLTKFGQFLRASSLDELPALWNVFRGEMSFVGPRPLLLEYLPLYSAEQARRHEVLPGITGLAQVRGRNAITWEEKFQHDVDYVRHVSLGFDLKILASTIGTVLSRKGISADSCATMPAFAGTRAAGDLHDRAA